MSRESLDDDNITGLGDLILNRSRFIAVSIACALLVLLAGCSRKGPVDVRFIRHVDKAGLDQLTKQGGDVVLLADAAFWTDRETSRAVPIARREKTFIIGPGATQMAGEMLARMFDQVVTVRRLELVPDLAYFDYVIQLVLDSFDDRTLTFPIFSNQRYLVELGAEITRADGSFVGRIDTHGAESFWFRNLAAANPYRSDARLLEKASNTLNAAVQESLFEMMDELEVILQSAP
jgi:hypothetical protein